MAGELVRTFFLKSSMVFFRYWGCWPEMRGMRLFPV